MEQWSEIKAVEFWQPANDNIGAVSVTVLDVVYKLRVALLAGLCLCSSTDNVWTRVKPQHKLVSTAFYW